MLLIGLALIASRGADFTSAADLLSRFPSSLSPPLLDFVEELFSGAEVPSPPSGSAPSVREIWARAASAFQPAGLPSFIPAPPRPPASSGSDFKPAPRKFQPVSLAPQRVRLLAARVDADAALSVSDEGAELRALLLESFQFLLFPPATSFLVGQVAAIEALCVDVAAALASSVGRHGAAFAAPFTFAFVFALSSFGAVR